MSTVAHLPGRPVLVGPLAYAPRHDGESAVTGERAGGEDAAGLTDLASRALGGSVLVANDWFGRDAGLDTERAVDRVDVELIPDGGLSRLRSGGVR